MKTRISLLALASAAALASPRANAAVALSTAPLPNPWTFTASNGGWVQQVVASPGAGQDAMVFAVTATGVGPTRVTRMAFMVTGTVLNGEVANFELVYYPAGVASPGIVVGRNSGAGFAPGRNTSLVSIDLTSPIAVEGDFTGDFALRVDVNGGRAYSFQPRLQTVTVSEGGAERYLRETEDLPLNGDSIHVN